MVEHCFVKLGFHGPGGRWNDGHLCGMTIEYKRMVLAVQFIGEGGFFVDEDDPSRVAACYLERVQEVAFKYCTPSHMI